MPEETQIPQEMTLDQAAEAFGDLEQPRRRAASEKSEKRETKQEPRQEATKAALEGEDQPEEDEESEEAEEPETEEPESEEEEADEDEDDPESELTVTLDGKKQRIKLGELVKGHLRTADYTRKTQQLAEERKKFEGELNSARQQREYYAQALGQMQQAIESITPTPAQEPDWNAIARTHGVDKAFEAQTTWNQAMRQRAQIEAERERIAQEAEAEQAQARQTRLAEERELMLEAIPGWKNPAKAERERKAMIDFAKTVGFRDDDINQVSDHRAVYLLHLAWIGHQVTEKQKTLKPAPEVESVKTARPSNGHVRSRNPISDAARRLEKSGDVDDAADFFSAALKNERRRR